MPGVEDSTASGLASPGGSAFSRLPPDIIIEIAGWLNGIDVLYLARASKFLRRPLMSRSSIGAWKSALRHSYEWFGTPLDCIPGLSIPATLSLAYDNDCHGCGHKRIITYPCFQLNTRMCENCMQERLYNLQEFKFKGNGLFTAVTSCIPTAQVKLRDAEGYSDYWSFFCFVDEKDSFLKRFAEVGNAKKHLAKLKAAGLDSLNSISSAWLKWYLEYCQRRVLAVQEIQQSRLRSIEKRLKFLGYENIMQYMSEQDAILRIPGVPEVCMIKDHPLVKMPRLLTNKGWWHLEETMRVYMESVREYVLTKIQVDNEEINAGRILECYRRQIRSVSPERLIPGAADLLCWKPCASLVTEMANQDEHEMTIPLSELFDTELISFMNQFEEQGLHEMLKLDAKNKYPLDDNLPTIERYITKLKLATSTFRCDSSNHELFDENRMYSAHMPLWIPEALHHPCNALCKRAPDLATLDLETWKLDRHLELGFAECPGVELRRTTWSTKHLQFDYKAQTSVESILAACNLDPATTTVGDLDTSDPRFVCLECSCGHEPDGERILAVWSWRNAVEHALEKHGDISNVRWYRVSDNDAAEARALGGHDESPANASFLRQDIWRCRLCQLSHQDPGRLRMDQLRHHFDARHYYASIGGKLQEDEHYYRAPDAPALPYTIFMKLEAISKPTSRQ